MSTTKISAQRRLSAAVLSCLSAAFSMPSVATDGTGVVLGQIEILASAEGVTPSRMVTEYTVTDADIERRGARTLDRALALVPGLNIRTGGDGTPRIDIRGLRTREVQLLINGVPLNAADSGQFDPTLIPTDFISEIRVLSGSPSVLYGEGGTAGIINIITKKGSGETAGTFSAQTSSDYNRRAAFQLGGANRGFDFLVVAAMLDQADFALSRNFAPTPEQTGRTRANSNANRTYLYANAGTAGADWDFGITANYVEGDNGKPAGVINSTSDLFASKPQYQRTQDIANTTLQLASDCRLDELTLASGWLYANSQRQTDIRYDDATLSGFASNLVRGTFSLRSDNRTDGGHAQLNRTISAISSMAWTADWRREVFGQTGVIRDVAVSGGGRAGGGGGGTTYTLRNVDTRDSSRVASLGMEWQARWTGLLQTIAGIGLVQQSRTRGSSAHATIGNLAASYAIGGETWWRLAASRRVRAPSVQQLYDAGSGNPDLRVEQNDNVETGIDWSWGGGNAAKLSAFHAISRYFVQNDAVTGIAVNRDRYAFSGLEGTLQYRVTPAWRLQTGYSYLRAEDKSPDSATTELQYRPGHKFTIDSAHDLSSHLGLSVSFTGIRDQVYFSRTTPLQTRALNNIGLVDARLSYRAAPAASVFIGVDNLTDRNYETSYGFPQRGRFIYAGIRLGL